jgi:quinohemoprotein amine dehydrogenase
VSAFRRTFVGPAKAGHYIYLLYACFLVLPLLLMASPQQPQQPASAADEGIPVTDPEVVKACGSCHVRDEQQRMTRISYRRATPENWELTIRRMMSLNGVDLTPETARRIIKYLSDHHGLAPEEARPAMFDAERRLIDYTYEPDSEVHRLCSTCHSIGRVISERRTRQEWVELIAMHRYYYPGIDGASGGFRRGGGGGGGGAAGSGTAAGARGTAAGGPADAQGDRGRTGPGGRGADNRQPYERAQDHLAGAFPLMSPEWAAWSAAMRTPRLAGRWALAGYEIGKGPVFGQMTISDRPDAPDGFLADGRFVYTRTGQTMTRRSRAVVYAGFQWRGRSADAPDDPGTWREVALIERNGQEIKGRWFTGAHDETGIDIMLRRVANDPTVMGTDVSSLKTSSSSQRVRIYGANLPQKAAPADIDFGQGVKVLRVVTSAADMLTVEVDVAADARIGPRDLSIGGSTKSAAVVVYAKIDGIKVLPLAGLARLGGAAFPARPEQFEARGVSHGLDGKPGGGDDLDLGPLDVRWSLEEYTATFKDDDVQFVGGLSQSGLFTPNLDGPNPKRSGNRNNVGDVWVVAAYTPASDSSARPLRARAHLLVTVPIYIDWAPREVGR